MLRSSLILCMKYLIPAIFFAFGPVGVIHAQSSPSSCQYVYGGGQTCIQKGKVILNKTIQHPESAKLVDSLSITDAKLLVNQTVTFHLTLTNTDKKIINNITVTDTIPQYLTFVSGDGKLDEIKNTVSFTIDKLNPGEAKTHLLRMIVAPIVQSSPAQDTTCTINQAKATYAENNISQDNVQFCIDTRILGEQTVSQTPATGAGILALIGLIPAGLAGIFLRKKALKREF